MAILKALPLELRFEASNLEDETNGNGIQAESSVHGATDELVDTNANAVEPKKQDGFANMLSAGRSPVNIKVIKNSKAKNG